MAPKNTDVAEMNKKLLLLIPGDSRIYKSVDKPCDPSETVQYLIAFLNSLRPSGLPPHELHLKIGAPIIVVRSLQPLKVVNGTRLVIKQLIKRLIEATILTGVDKGEDVLIPRFQFISTGVAFQFKRIQFPIRLSFAMSINKPQGQSLHVAGLHLTSPCFLMDSYMSLAQELALYTMFIMMLRRE